MKYLITLTVGLCMLFAAAPVVAQSAADEAAVQEATEQYLAAFNKHDGKAIAPLIDENCQTWTGGIKKKADYVKMQEDRFARMKDVQINFAEDIGIDFIAPNIAIHKYYTASSGWLDADGNPSPPGRGLNGTLYVKTNGQWLRRAVFWQSVEE